MRSRKVVIIITFIITWTFVTYYLLIRNTTDLTFQNKKEVYKKLEELELGAQNEISRQDQLIRDLIGIIKLKTSKDSLSATIGKGGGIGDGVVLSSSAINGDSISSSSSTISRYYILSKQQQQQQPEQESQLIQSRVDEIESVIKEIPLEEPKFNENFYNNYKLPKNFVKGIDGPVIPVLVFACNRVSVSKCLDNLIQYRPSIEQFPIIVSQDCGDESTKKVIQSYKDQVTLIEQPDQSDIFVPPKEKKFKGYYKIARHYGWALNTTFRHGYDYVIIVEDDLNVAPDFFEYFLGTHHLLKKDPSLWCISAWNDNGKIGLVDTSKPELLYRTDFFPGLGWMLTKELWNELSPKWPKSFWDDWIRHPLQRKERVCIRPELSRTRTFGKIGVSNGLFFDKYLKHIKLSEEYVPFRKLNLTYLIKENYDNTFLKHVYECPVVTYDELRRGLVKTKEPIRIQYNTKDQYKRTAKMLGLMDDFKSGVPRTGYHGIVSFFYNNQRVYLAPNANWKGYDLSWS